LIRSQVQLLGQMLERVAPMVWAHSAVSVSMFRPFCVKAEATEREGATNRKCYKCSFHE
jgi:hypothetical protein